MFVDASAMVAILVDERDAEALTKRLEQAVEPCTSPIAIYETVAAVARGETRLSPEIQGELVRQIQLRGIEDRPVLSPREREVLVFIADGLSAPDIAARLHLSPATIKTHLQSLYDKLGVSDRAAAVARAMRLGLLE